VQPQGAQHTGFSYQARRRLYAVVAVLLASATVEAAEPKKKDGAIVYEEQSRSRIVYHEETGGMKPRTEAPVQEPPKDRATSTTAAPSASARRTAQRGDAVAAK
jgi:hypothetical protein